MDEWIRLIEAKEVLAQVAPKPQGGRPHGGINAATRELGIDRTQAQRSVKVASISQEAKQEAVIYSPKGPHSEMGFHQRAHLRSALVYSRR